MAAAEMLTQKLSNLPWNSYKPFFLNPVFRPTHRKNTILCFDIETTGLSPKHCKVTVVCAEDFTTGECHIFEFARYPERAQELVDSLVEVFDNAKSLCAFNGLRFDIPFMATALRLPDDKCAAWAMKTSDILEQSRNRFSKTFSLNVLCETNNIPIKISDGKEAIRMAERGEWDKLNEYCAKDVSILCDLYRKQHIKLPRANVAVNLADWARPGLYHERPAFLHYTRHCLEWSPAECAALRDILAARGDAFHVSDIMDRKVLRNGSELAVTLIHNEVSEAWDTYDCAMSSLEDEGEEF